jgi:hypothetical protein
MSKRDLIIVHKFVQRLSFDMKGVDKFHAKGNAYLAVQAMTLSPSFKHRYDARGLIIGRAKSGSKLEWSRLGSLWPLQLVVWQRQ